MKSKCQACKDGVAFELPITMAFQPILDISTNRVFAHEALLRGKGGESPGDIIGTLNDQNRYAFDQLFRKTAIELAAGLNLADRDGYLSINFLPNAVYEPRACIQLTLRIAEVTGFPVERIMFEFTESERLDTDHLLKILWAYRALGFKTAIDDFGAGYAGLDLLTRFQPDIIKLDMELTRGIDTSPVKQVMLRNMANMMDDLGIQMICEGIETQAEFDVLRDNGVTLLQGYFFARPELEALPDPVWPDTSPDTERPQA